MVARTQSPLARCGWIDLINTLGTFHRFHSWIYVNAIASFRPTDHVHIFFIWRKWSRGATLWGGKTACTVLIQRRLCDRVLFCELLLHSRTKGCLQSATYLLGLYDFHLVIILGQRYRNQWDESGLSHRYQRQYSLALNRSVRSRASASSEVSPPKNI